MTLLFNRSVPTSFVRNKNSFESLLLGLTLDCLSLTNSSLPCGNTDKVSSIGVLDLSSSMHEAFEVTSLIALLSNLTLH